MAGEGIKSISDQIVSQLPGIAEPAVAPAAHAPAPATPAAAAPGTPAAPATPATPTRDPATGQFKSEADTKAHHLSEMNKIVKGAVEARKRVEAEKSDLQRELDGFRRQLHGAAAVPAPVVNLDDVISGLEKNGQLSEADAKHYRGAGKTILEAFAKTINSPSIDPETLQEFNNFSKERKFLKQAGEAFDSWRAERVAEGDQGIADPELARATLRKWNSGGGVLTPEAFNLAYDAARYEAVSSKVEDPAERAARQAARAAAGASNPADMGSGAPVDSVRVRREAIREMGRTGRSEDLGDTFFRLLGGDETFFAKNKE